MGTPLSVGGKVDKKALTITIIAVMATAASVVIGARAIVGTAAALRHSTQSNEAEQGSLEKTGSEIEALLDDLADSQARDGEGTARDPMVPYRVPRKRSTSKPAAPAKPTYGVTAVFIDENPTAIMLVNGRSVRVNLGDLVGSGRVVAIDEDGVTIDGDGGEKKYGYSPN